MLFATRLSWEPLTASVEVELISPGATLVILLPPLFKPELVKDTLPPPLFLIVIPLPFVTVVWPELSIVVMELIPVISFAKRTFKLPLLSEITPILFAEESLLSSVTPPLTVTFSPKLRWNSPLSPAKSKPAFLRPSIPFFKSPMLAPFVKLLLLSAILLISSPSP